jgi:hypothetical protein
VIERTPQRAYLDLQKLAREQGRNTQQLFELYVHERFLARLAESRFADKFVLKGGMLLAVLDVRRGTRDADMLARDLASDESNLRAVIGEIASVSMADGVDFDTTVISIAPIREGAEYEGVAADQLPDAARRSGFSAPGLSACERHRREGRHDDVSGRREHPRPRLWRCLPALTDPSRRR